MNVGPIQSDWPFWMSNFILKTMFVVFERYPTTFRNIEHFFSIPWMAFEKNHFWLNCAGQAVPNIWLALYDQYWNPILQYVVSDVFTNRKEGRLAHVEQIFLRKHQVLSDTVCLSSHHSETPITITMALLDQNYTHEQCSTIVVCMLRFSFPLLFSTL